MNWDFLIRWIDDEHILLSFEQDGKTHDIAMPVHNYVEFMELAQTFNLQFREQLDEQILKHYLNG